MSTDEIEYSADPEYVRQALQELFEAQNHEEVVRMAKNLTGFFYSSGLLFRWSGAITRRIGWGKERVEDVQQVIAERLLHHLTGRTERLKKILHSRKNVVASIFQMLSGEAWTYSQSSESTGITGASGFLRRAGRYRNFERELAQTLGRTPETSEVVQAANAAATATRKNPDREGILLDGENHRPPLSTDTTERQPAREKQDVGLDPALMHDFIEVIRQISTTLMVLYPEELPDVVRTLKAWFWAHKEGAIAQGPDEHVELGVYAGISSEVARHHLTLIYSARDAFLAEQAPKHR